MEKTMRAIDRFGHAIIWKLIIFRVNSCCGRSLLLHRIWRMSLYMYSVNMSTLKKIEHYLRPCWLNDRVNIAGLHLLNSLFVWIKNKYFQGHPYIFFFHTFANAWLCSYNYHESIQIWDMANQSCNIYD